MKDSKDTIAATPLVHTSEGSIGDFSLWRGRLSRPIGLITAAAVTIGTLTGCGNTAKTEDKPSTPVG